MYFYFTLKLYCYIYSENELTALTVESRAIFEFPINAILWPGILWTSFLRAMIHHWTGILSLTSPPYQLSLVLDRQQFDIFLCPLILTYLFLNLNFLLLQVINIYIYLYLLNGYSMTIFSELKLHIHLLCIFLWKGEF